MVETRTTRLQHHFVTWLLLRVPSNRPSAATGSSSPWWEIRVLPLRGRVRVRGERWRLLLERARPPRGHVRVRRWLASNNDRAASRRRTGATRSHACLADRRIHFAPRLRAPPRREP